MTGEQIDDMYRLLAIAKYEERYVIPAAHAEDAPPAWRSWPPSAAWTTRAARAWAAPARSAEAVRHAARRSRWRTSTCCASRQTADTSPTATRRQAARVNLLNWDGKGRPEGLFPPRPDGGAAMTRDRPWRPVAARAASLLLRYPDADVLAALPTLRGGARRAADARWPSRCGWWPTTAPSADAGRARRRVRRAVRLPAPLLPAPDLLHRRRHPEARRGAGRASPPPTGTPAWRSSTASCPTTCRPCSTWPRVDDAGWRAAARATASGSTCSPRPSPAEQSVYRHAVEAVRALLPPARPGDIAAAAPPGPHRPAREQVGLEPFGARR